MVENVPNLTRLTVTYVHEEDRMQFSGVDNDGRSLKLWLTARLLNRLMPHLVRQQIVFEEVNLLDADGCPDTRTSQGDSLVPVDCEVSGREVLVTEVDLQVQAQSVRLIFKEAPCNACATFTLSSAALPELNRGLQHCFQQAGWPGEFFKNVVATPPEGPYGVVTFH